MKLPRMLARGARTLALQFLLPLALVVVAVIAVHWIGA